jgi:hypothetical protein
MRKIILGAIATAIAASVVPASADPTVGCEVAGGDTPAGTSCTFVSTGADLGALILTPNHVDVTYVNDLGDTVTLYSNASADPFAQGPKSFDNAPAGKTVTVTVGPDDAEGFIEGWIGIVGVRELV